VLLSLGYGVFVWTDLGHQLDANAYFGRDLALHRVIQFDHRILGAVSKGTLALMIAIVFVVGLIRRTPMVGLIAAVGIAVAVVGAEILKHILPWKPMVALDADYTAGLLHDSYPSGHTTIATSVSLAMVIVLPARWRPWLAVAAGVVSASYATGVVFAGWHRPSDAIGGILWTGTCLSLAAWIAVWMRGHSVADPADNSGRGPLLGSIVAAVAVLLIALVGALVGSGSYPDADASFIIMVTLIVVATFTLTAWYGRRLHSVDWRS